MTDVNIADKLTYGKRSEVQVSLERYPDVLTRLPGRTGLIQHDIKFLKSELERSKGYPFPYKSRGLIEPSVSPYSSPIVLVPKKTVRSSSASTFGN